METTWIVVADAARARVFAEAEGGELRELEDLVDPGARLKGRARDTDAPGLVFDRMGSGRHATGSANSGGEEARAFARRVAEFLDKGRLQHQYARLTLIAEPRFLGDLREALPHGVARLVVRQADKDLAQLPAHELMARIRSRA